MQDPVATNNMNKRFHEVSVSPARVGWVGWVSLVGLVGWLVGLLARWLVDLQVCRFVGFLGCVPDFECKQREQVSEQLNVRT